MTPAEAADLLTRCSAFDNRKPSEIAARAWAHSLKNVPLDADAFAAVDRFYGTPPAKPGERLWIQPHDVRTHRKIIRAERLANFVYEPPGEQDPQYLKRLRGQLDAVASGREPPPTERPALEGGPHPDLTRVLAGVGRRVPGEPVSLVKVRRKGPLGIKCPKCSAPVGRPCRLPGRQGKPGRERAPHEARRAAARGEQVTAESPADIERRRQIFARKLAEKTEGADR